MASGKTNIGNRSLIKSIQRGSLSILGGQTTRTDTITAVDPAKSIIKVSFATTGSSNADDSSIAAEIVNATTVRFVRSGSGGVNTGTIYWEVIEFNNVKSKQSGIKTNTTTGTETQAITAINPAKSMIFASHTNSFGSPSSDAMVVYSAITNSTTLTFQCSQPTATIYWQVIEFR